MRAPALPLQILLALALILNGIAGAVAGVSAIVALPFSAMAAHEGGSHGHVAIEDVAHPDSSHAGANCHPGDASDCDRGSHCLQACMQAQAMVALVPFPGIAPRRAGVALHALATGHPAPLLASPTRPPIG